MMLQNTNSEQLSNSIHGGKQLSFIIQQYSSSYIPLIILCGRSIKQSQTVRSGRFELNLLTLQGIPKHTSRGYSQSHTCNISLFFPGCGSGTPSSTTEYDDSAPACAHEKRRSKKVREKSTRRANQLLKLTDYHISRHVVSTFKRLTTTTTHCGLIIFY